MGGALALTIELGVVYCVIWVRFCFALSRLPVHLSRHLGIYRRRDGYDGPIGGRHRRSRDRVRADRVQPERVVFRARILGVRPWGTDASHGASFKLWLRRTQLLPPSSQVFVLTPHFSTGHLSIAARRRHRTQQIHSVRRRPGRLREDF